MTDPLEERLASHAVHGTLGLVREQVESLTPEQMVAMDATGSQRVPHRADVMCDYIDGLLDQADPALVPQATLENINAQAAQVREYLQQAGSDPAFAGNADQAIDAVLNSVGPLVAARRSAGVKKTGEALGSLKPRLAKLDRYAENIQKGLSKLDEEHAALAQATREADEERAAALQARAAQVETAVATEQAKIDALIPKFESLFSASQTEREQEASQQISVLRERADAAAEAVEGQSKATLAALEERSNEIIRDAEAKRERVEQLYGLITDKAVSGAFGDEAESQKLEADKWRIYAIRLGLLSAVVAILAVAFSALDQHGSATAHWSGLAVAVFLSGITAYAAKQSGGHREREVRSKRLNLELTAFGPFTDTMGDPTNAREQYALRLFRGAEDQPTPRDDDHVTVAQSIGEGLIDLLRSRGK